MSAPPSSISSKSRNKSSNRKSYDTNQLAKALIERKRRGDSVSFRSLEAQFAVPYRTINHWWTKFDSAEEFSSGKCRCSVSVVSTWISAAANAFTAQLRALTSDQEKELVRLIVSSALAGKGFNLSRVCEEAKRIREGLTDEQHIALIKAILESGSGVGEVKIPAMSRHWAADFLKRHKSELSKRTPSSLTKARAAGLNREAVGEFFKRIQKDIDEYKLSAGCIANFDEKGFEGEAENSRKIITPKRMDHANLVRGAYRDHWSVGAIIFADGKLAPPIVAFKGARFPPSLMTHLPADSLSFVQQNGYFTQTTFPDVLKHIHYHRPIKNQSLLLILDNSDSHLDSTSAELAKELNIILQFLPPNCTHRLQPLDVCFFGPLSSNWNKSVGLHGRLDRDHSISRYSLAKIFTNAWNWTNKSSTIINGFSKTGIWPFSPDRIEDFEYLPSIPSSAAPAHPQSSPSSALQIGSSSEVAELKLQVQALSSQVSDLRAIVESLRQSISLPSPPPARRAVRPRPPMLKQTTPIVLSHSSASAMLEQQNREKSAAKKTSNRKRKASDSATALGKEPRRAEATSHPEIASEDELLLDLTL